MADSSELWHMLEGCPIPVVPAGGAGAETHGREWRVSGGGGSRQAAQGSELQTVKDPSTSRDVESANSALGRPPVVDG